MIRYSPPKSQVWGHQVGRLPAVAVVERLLRFLEARCTILNSMPSELMLGWNDAEHDAVSEIAADINRTLGEAKVANELAAAGGQVFRQRRWPFSPELLPAVATWFDRLADLQETQAVVAQSSTLWNFAWRDEPPPLVPLESPGGMVGVHLGRPHRITTMFTFRDLDHYVNIKAALSELELV